MARKPKGPHKPRRVLGRYKIPKSDAAARLRSYEVKIAVFVPKQLELAVRDKAALRGVSVQQAIRIALAAWVPDWESYQLPIVTKERTVDGLTNLGAPLRGALTRERYRAYAEAALKNELAGQQLLFDEEDLVESPATLPDVPSSDGERGS